MENYLNIAKLEYLSNHLLDYTKIVNINLYDHTIFNKSLKRRGTQMEDNLQIIKMEYLCNHLLDPTQISNSRLYDQTLMYIKTTSNWRRPRYGSWLVSS